MFALLFSRRVVMPRWLMAKGSEQGESSKARSNDGQPEGISYLSHACYVSILCFSAGEKAESVLHRGTRRLATQAEYTRASSAVTYASQGTIV